MTRFEIGRLARTLMLQPLEWGRRDCAMDAADVWNVVTGRDPMADLRGSYASRFEYRRLVMSGGGLVCMARDRMSTEAAFSGDGVGIIDRDGLRFFAIGLGGRFIARSTQGGVADVTDGTVLEAWSW